MDNIEHEVQHIFAELTRYPIDVLEPTADLEDDLGIDSVKRGEILAVFRTRFDLPETLEVPPERLSTIAGIADVLRSLVGGGSPRPSAAAERPVEPLASAALRSGHGAAGDGKSGNGAAAPASPGERPPAPWSRPDVERIVVDTMAEVTRYPREILTPDADLEEDLGIDSVKRGEIFSVLRERLGFPEVRAPLAIQIDTVADVASAALELLENLAPSASASAFSPLIEPPVTDGGADGAGQPAIACASWMFSPERKPFTGKVALVTGSGHGIGRAIACQLADLGARVVVNSFHSRDRGEATAAAIRTAGGKAEHVWGSVANPGQLKKIFEGIEQQFGYLDFFVSNASNGMIAPLKDITEQHWERAFRTNVIGLHQGAMLAAHLMRRRGGGKIVTISSPGAQRYIEHFGCMGPVKAALESLTRYLAVELAQDNIQVNAISAGPIYGELLSKYPDAERLIPYWESLSAGHRLGEQSDVANFATYLLSEGGNKITGSVLLVDSGGSQRI